jgi:BlaR1 peptidase M56
VASLALAAGALAAAGVFARAAVRYRFLAVAFGLVAAIAPLALLAAALRPAGSGVPASAAVAGLGAYVVPLLLLAGAVAGALLLELACDVVRLRRIKRGADVLGTVPVRGALIGVSPTVATPTAIGYFHPAVVVPAGFRTRVDDGEWDAVIAHECAHLARADDWAKALQSAVMRTCWWLPGLWLLGRALDLERELASDERAAHETGPRRYAACLLRLATDRGAANALAPAFWGRRSHVAIRVERLLRPAARTAPIVRAAALGAFTAAALAVLALAAVAVPSAGHRSSAPALRPVRLAAVAAPRRRPAAKKAIASHLMRTVTITTHAPSRAAVSALVPDAAVPAPAAVAATVARVAPPAAAEATRPQTTKPYAVAAAAPRAAAAAHDTLTGAVRRAEPRRAPPLRPVAASPELLAFTGPTAPRPRCATCFGPLRSPDGAYAPSSASSAPAPAFGGSSGGIVAVAPDDPTGATELKPGLLWIRLPRSSVP